METRICSVSDCQEIHHAKGFCNRHYKKWKRGRLNLGHKKAAQSNTRTRSKKLEERCRVHGCFATGNKRGYCEIHYKRYEMLKAFSQSTSKVYLEDVLGSLEVMEEDSEHLSELIPYYDQ
ncbi:MAG: hypothetical protein HY730_08330 [Candidatus Tectomicrobia bacterium]|uniref:Uncharacterized protein n=1 Tax=Tectimicrobiota bacterium TaxID=2528274 RepID=A0A933GMX0_UNCTE|nr:hypothetical protein [Candidatus Tectomicrobia bacterium]